MKASLDYPPREAREQSGGAFEHDPERSSALALLGQGDALEVLARIIPGDPLGLRARISARLAQEALLLDVEHVLLVAQACCALRAPRWRGEPSLEAWLAARIGEAFALVLAEEAGRSDGPGALGHLAASLALDARALARACARFHALEAEPRAAFFALVLESEDADRLARSNELSLSEVARRARLGLEALRCSEFGRPASVSHELRWAKTS